MAEELRRLRIKRTEQLEKEGRKAVGFYREGGKTRPITKPKPKKRTRVIKKVVPPSQMRPSLPWDPAWRSWITGLITKAGEDPNLVDIQIHSDGVDIIPKWAPGSVFDRENMKRYEATMQLIKAPWNDARAMWELRAKAAPAATKSRNTRVANAGSATRLKFDKAVKGANKNPALVGFHMGPTTVIALLVDVNEAIQGASKAIVKFIQSLPRPPDASYRRITQASLGKSIKGAHDPKDRPYLYIGDTVYGKEPLKVALRTLGGRNIRVYSMGTDQPVFLMNDADEAVIIAPTISFTGPDDFLRLRLKDIAS